MCVQAIKVGTYEEALAAGGGGRPGQSVAGAGVPAKLPGWHGTSPDVVKYIQTTAPGKEVSPSTAFCGLARSISCPTAQGGGCAVWYVCRNAGPLDMPGTLNGPSLELLHETLNC